MEILKYSNYLTENTTIGKNNTEVFKKMAVYITRRFKDEDSIIFTYWIGKIFNFKKFLFISSVTMSESFKDVKNVYCMAGDRYYDGKGFHTKEEVIEEHHMSKWSFNDYTFTGGMEKLSDCVKEKDLKLGEKLQTELTIVLNKYRDTMNLNR